MKSGNIGKRKISVSYNYIILMVCMFLIFFSYTKDVLTMEALIIGSVLVLINLRRRIPVDIMLAFMLCIFALLQLVMSGRITERGFNSPISHAYKFIYLFFIIVLSNYMGRLSEEHRKSIITLVFLVSAGVSLYSIFYCQITSEWAIRDSQFGNDFIIGFEQVYGYLIIASLLFLSMMYQTGKKSRWNIMILLIFVLVIIYSRLTTALLLLGVGVAIGLIIYFLEKKQTKFVVLMIILIFGIILLFAFSETVTLMLYRLAENFNWETEARLKSLIDMIFGGKSNTFYSLDRRIELGYYSISSFKDHIFFGIGYSDYEYGTIGGHQEWMDLLGVFGLFGGIAFLITIFLALRNRYLKADYLGRRCILLSSIIFFTLGFLNPCLNNVCLASVLVIAPNISSYIKVSKKGGEPNEY